MARRFVQIKQLFDEPHKKCDDATSSGDHAGENKMVEWRINPVEGHTFTLYLYYFLSYVVFVHYADK